MIHKGYINNVEAGFLDENIFREKDDLIVRDAKNIDEDNDKPLPSRIRLKDIEMDPEEKNKIIKKFLFKKKKKEASKGKRKLAEII